MNRAQKKQMILDKGLTTCYKCKCKIDLDNDIHMEEDYFNGELGTMDVRLECWDCHKKALNENLDESEDILDKNGQVHYTNGEFKECDCGTILEGTEQSDSIYTYCPKCDTT